MNFRKIFCYFIIIISSLVIIASLLSLVYDLPYWYSKLLDFPRLQYLILAILCLLLFVSLTKEWKWPSFLLISGLIGAIAIQAVIIFPYWMGDKAVPDAIKNYSEANTVSILLANVLITNRESKDFLKVVRESEADLVLVMEVNEWWNNELKSLKNSYPNVITRANKEAYGMVLLSKLPINDTSIKYLKHENVPSFHVIVELRSGKKFSFHGVHPVAPMPSDKYPDNVGEAEVELLKVGNLVAEEELPSIVAGDFNDVSWSHTARLFGSSGELKNVRLGRGLYNTFNANSKIMRWPLDHYFVTEEFQLVSLKRLSKIGSDHFPMYAEFVLAN